MRNDLTTLDWSIQLKLSDCKSFVTFKCLRGRGNLIEENQLLLTLSLCIVVSFIFPIHYYVVLHCVLVCHRIKNQKKTGSSWFRSLRIKTSVCSSLCLLKAPENPMQWWWSQYKLVVEPNLLILRSFSLLNLKTMMGLIWYALKCSAFGALSPGDCGRFLFIWHRIISFVKPFLLALSEHVCAWTILLCSCECK